MGRKINVNFKPIISDTPKDSFYTKYNGLGLQGFEVLWVYPKEDLMLNEEARTIFGIDDELGFDAYHDVVEGLMIRFCNDYDIELADLTDVEYSSARIEILMDSLHAQGIRCPRSWTALNIEALEELLTDINFHSEAARLWELIPNESPFGASTR